MPVHPPCSDPTIVAARSRASDDFKTAESTHPATGARLELAEMAKFFGSLMMLYMLTGLGIFLVARLMA